MDTHGGDPQSPGSLHKYLYVSNDAVNLVDPTGKDGLLDSLIASAMNIVIAVAAVVAVATALEYVTSVFGKSLSDPKEINTVDAAIAVLDPVQDLYSEAQVLRTAKYRRSKPPYLYGVCIYKGGCFAAAHYGFLFLDDQFFDQNLLHDSVERAAVLLHEAFHLEGGNEHDAYAGVWVNKEKFGWTETPYSHYFLWGQVKAETMNAAPELFQ